MHEADYRKIDEMLVKMNELTDLLRLKTSRRMPVRALYHIATCQMMGVSVLKYFKHLFAAIAAGRTDYERSTLSLVLVESQEYVADDN